MNQCSPSHAANSDVPDEFDFPVFILGSPRSGTSTIAQLLHDHFEYDGFAEGHLLTLYYKLDRVCRDHFVQLGLHPAPAVFGSQADDYGSVVTDNEAKSAKNWEGSNLAAAVGETAIRRQLRRWFRAEVRTWYSRRWFEKTPGTELIEAAPSLRAMYDKALFIFLIRDPVGNVESRLRKFPEESFKRHCEEWTKANSAWLAVRQKLPPKSFIEIHTHEMASDPHAVFQRISAHLEQHELPEAIRSKPVPTHFLEIQRTSTGPLSTPRTLADTDWSEEQKEQFLKTCGPLSEQFDFCLEQQTQPGGNRTLPPPYGQKDIVVSTGQGGGVWPEIRDARIWIFMHPSVGCDTLLRYTKVNLNGARQIETSATVTNPLSPPVCFEIVLYDEAFGNELARISEVCIAGTTRSLTLAVPDVPLYCCALELRTRTLTGGNKNAWALVQPPRIIMLHADP